MILQLLLAAAGAGFPTEGIVVKPSDETRTSDTTLGADSDLQFTTEPNTTYFIRCAFIAWAASAPDMKWTIGHTGTTDAAMFSARRAGTMDNASAGFMAAGNNDFWMITAAMMAAETPVDVPIGNSSFSGHRVVGFFEGILEVGASGGVFALKWAQNTSSLDSTTVKAGSWIHHEIISSGVAIKAADTERTNTTTATADPDLQAVLAVGTDYAIHMGVMGSAGTTPDFKIGIDDGGGTPTYFGGFVNISENAYDLSVVADANEQLVKTIGALTAATTQPMTGDSTAGYGNFYDLECAGRFSVEADPFALIWAQNTSSGTATKILADSYLLAREITSPDQIVWKTVDETRSSDTTLTDDDDLTVSLTANAAYLVSIVVLFASPATADIKVKLEFTGTCEDFTGILDWQDAGVLDQATNGGAQVYTFTGTDGAFQDTLPVAGNSTANTYGGLRYTGLLRVGSSAGDLKVTWAQNASDAGNTTVLAGSYILVERKA